MHSKSLPFYVAACVTGWLGTNELQAGEAKNAKQPNIIFILCDDLGYGDLGYQFQNLRAKSGDRSEPWTKTPNLDKMAAEGVQLPYHFCPAPVCAPSRASLMLGQSQGHSNVRDNQFDKALEDNHTIASILRKAGYATAAIGKWGLQGKNAEKPDWPAHPLNRGFDYYFGYIRHGDGHEHYPKEGLYRNPKEVYENRTNIADQLDKCYTADLWTAAAKRWIIEQKMKLKSEKPFFLYLAFDTPHAVIELPTQAYPKGTGLRGGLKWLGKPGQMINTASGTVDSWMHPDYANATWDHDKNPSTPEIPWPDVYKRYATSTRRIDSAVGDLVGLLRDLKMDENTVIVFSTDNGPSKESYLKEAYDPDFFNGFGPFDGIKRDLLQGGVRVSALAYWPGHFQAGKMATNPSILYDWLPTFAELAGVAAPAVTDGVSLVPTLTGKGKQRPSTVYVEYFEGGKTPPYQEFLPEHRDKRRNQMQMLVLDNYIGLRYDIKSHNDKFEIYALNDDPQQGNNLAGNPGMEMVARQMQDKVLQIRRADESAPRPYDVDQVPSVGEMDVKPGISWKSYTGSFLWVPDFSSLTPARSGTAVVPHPGATSAKPGQAIGFSGYIKIPSDGEYLFSLSSDLGAFLRIHEIALIDADYGYNAGTRISEKINLKAGLHPIRIHYLSKEGNQPNLTLEWSGPGFTNQPIPSSAFFHKEVN